MRDVARLEATRAEPDRAASVRLWDTSGRGSVWVSRGHWTAFLAAVRAGELLPERGTVPGSVRLPLGDLFSGYVVSVLITSEQAWEAFQLAVINGDFDDI
ncbi:hypothetical protein [Spongiactinospora rosea]|uniref:hypothetical protein n=1 Tax=Spongiactinospora rosea TaxID=2248750 RepID=UPI0011C03EB9|nr:hypothetical protein [Spongiactinospora rosea]